MSRPTGREPLPRPDPAATDRDPDVGTNRGVLRTCPLQHRAFNPPASPVCPSLSGSRKCTGCEGDSSDSARAYLPSAGTGLYPEGVCFLIQEECPMRASDSSQHSDTHRSSSAAHAHEKATGGIAPGLLSLQSSVGNAAVVQMLRRAHRSGTQEQHQHDADYLHPQSEPPALRRTAVHDALQTSGKPLDELTRSDMEARLGADLSDVRIHDDAAAKASATEIGARAYTSGSHVVIGQGGSDKHTLAHELTHVIQQRQGPVTGTDNGTGLKVSDPSDRFEREAESTARRVMSGPAAQVQKTQNVQPMTAPA
jgi:Domain of unknown function (DUF4157)